MLDLNPRARVASQSRETLSKHIARKHNNVRSRSSGSDVGTRSSMHNTRSKLG